MTSLKKIEANRRNAKLSTGPRDTSRTRLNSTHHGLLAKELFIQSERRPDEQQAFERLHETLLESLVPGNELEELIVLRIASLVWRVRRSIKYETASIQRYQDGLISRWDEEQKGKQSR